MTWSVFTAKADVKKGVQSCYNHKHKPYAFVIVVLSKYTDVLFSKTYTGNSRQCREVDEDVCG